MIDYDLLLSQAKEIGVDIGEYGADRFDTYAERLVRWNEYFNLTTITDPDEIVTKHFIDCLYIMKYVSFKPGEKLVDIGTGAGFPGLPLLIANPKIEMTFIDSSGKRIGFLKDVLNNMGLMSKRIHERAEVVGKDEKYREMYDYATARAVAPLNILCEYCLPFVSVGGLFIALKGPSGMQELKDARGAIKALGGELAQEDDYKLPNGDSRSIIIIRKISQTPSKYPRKSKKIATRPL